MNNPFVRYRNTDQPAEMALENLFERNGIGWTNQADVQAFLGPLKAKGGPYYQTFEHCIRVAELGELVAKFMHVDQKVLIFGGLLHDIGKVQVPMETLGRVTGWSDADKKNMEPHVIDAYRMLRSRFDFTAEVILWHHRFQAQPYPRIMPSPTHDYCQGTKILIPFYGRLLSLCDQFDAFHRVNDKLGTLRAPTGEEIKELMFRFNPDMRTILQELYNADIFTTDIIVTDEVAQ